MIEVPDDVRDQARDVMHLLYNERVNRRSMRNRAFWTFRYLRASLAILGSFGVSAPVVAHLLAMTEPEGTEFPTLSSLVVGLPKEAQIIVLVFLLPFIGLWIWYRAADGERKALIGETVARRLRACYAELPAHVRSLGSWSDVSGYLDELKFQRVLPHLRSACDEDAISFDLYPRSTESEAQAEADRILEKVASRFAQSGVSASAPHSKGRRLPSSDEIVEGLQASPDPADR